MTELINYYDKIKGKKKVLKDNDIDVEDNSRWLIVGKSGSMKTNTCLNLLKHLGMDTLTICAKDIEEPLYKDFLIPQIQKLEKKLKTHILDTHTEPEEIKNIDEFDPKLKNVIILDDQVVSPNQKNISQIYMRGRKRGITPIFITQSFFDTNKFVRKNIDYIILKSLSSVKDMKRILAEFNSNDIEPETLVEIHKQAIQKDPKNFILIDLKAQDPNKKYRINFKNYIPLDH
jgi:ABC-type dipeptide/oligopeptide/nickel transport system ATPase component